MGDTVVVASRPQLSLVRWWWLLPLLVLCLFPGSYILCRTITRLDHHQHQQHCCGSPVHLFAPSSWSSGSIITFSVLPKCTTTTTTTTTRHPQSLSLFQCRCVCCTQWQQKWMQKLPLLLHLLQLIINRSSLDIIYFDTHLSLLSSSCR